MPAPDPYLPGHGDDGYRVLHTDLRLDYKVTTNRLDELARLTVVVDQPLTRLELDLVGLKASRVTVDGARTRHRQTRNKLVVETGARKPGDRMELVIACAGKPTTVPGVHGAAGWEELTDGVIVASQPQGAPGWFPCNDDAARKGTYRIEVRAASGYRVVCNGTLAEHQASGGTTRWVYEMDQPMSPYLATVQIGRYTVDEQPAGVPVEVVHPGRIAVGAGTAFEHQGRMVDHLAELFGPYPFDQYRAVVVDDVLEIPLEAQGLSTFGRNFATPTWENERLVVHELAHQWFGNSVTAAQLADIWLHEGFACYSEWLWAEQRAASGITVGTQQQAALHHAGLKGQQQSTLLRNPGMRDMFDDWVYKRGALTLHAVRCQVGDELFFEILKSWTAEHAGGVVTTDDFIVHCTARAPEHAAKLEKLFDAWLGQTALPPLPVLR
ncbi:M1 family metallopeptidase [Luteococcus sediminum]|uniref:M1 family metallopeptidase n=1 Tax=Luteococcus sp. TaxID=1969402 RepID=UPI003735E7CF